LNLSLSNQTPSGISLCLVAALLFGVCLFLLPGQALALGEQLLHNPVIDAVAGEPLRIEATVESEASLPTEGRIYYRTPDQEAFSYIEMLIEQMQLTGEIPAEVVKEGEVEYYLEVYLSGDLTLTYPEGAPETEPILVVVRPARAAPVRGQQAVTVLSPEPGARIYEEQLLIAVSIDQSVRRLNPKALRIELDGEDLTPKASVSEDMVSVVVEKVGYGKHNAALYLVSKERREKLIVWGFMVPAPPVSPTAMGPVSGKVITSYKHEEIGAHLRNYTYLDGNARGNIGQVDWLARAYVTSLERGYLQSQHRFLGGLKYKGLILRAGDTNPRLSEFTLWGARTRGLELNLKSKSFNLGLVWGYMRRSIEGEVDSVFTTDPNTGLQDTTYSYHRGTYSRRLLAIRPGFPISRNATLSFNVLKVKDDEASIDEGAATYPKDNLVVGADLGMHFDKRRILFNSEFAISAYNSNTTDTVLSDAEDIEWLITVNQSFEPLPADEEILEAGIGKGTLAKKVFSELLKSSLAHRTSLTLNYFHNELRLGYKSFGRSFRSLGSPTVPFDINGFSIQDRLRLMNNRLYLTLGYEGYQDNVNGRSETTLDRGIFRWGIAYYTPPEYPNLNFGLRLYNRDNNGTEVFHPDTSDLVIADTRVDNKTTSYNFSINQSFELGGLDNTAVLFYNASLTDDEISEAAETDLSIFSLSLSSRLGRLLETRAAFSSTNQKSLGGDYENDYNVLSLSGRYMFIPKRLWLNGGLNLTLADGGNESLNPDPDDPAADPLTTRSFKLDFTRMQFSLGAEYLVSQRHSFSLNTYIVSHADDGYLEYWDGHSEKTEDIVKQNDFVTRLQYTYTF